MQTNEIEFEISQHFKSSVQLATSLVVGNVENAAPWRWVVLAIHDAIYCALVMKLSRTDMSGVYRDDLESRFTEFYRCGFDSLSPEWNDLSRAQAQSKLADLATLLKRANLSSGAMVHKSISSASGPARSLTLLKMRRDMFVHAGDYSLFTTDAELRGICIGSVDVLNEILAMSGHRYFQIGDVECLELVGELRGALHNSRP